jgi:prepilin-type N-terminal cleavage/methylation domain-containing protein
MEGSNREARSERSRREGFTGFQIFHRRRSRHTERNSREKGFTLIEIIVVLGVIAILAAVLTPTVMTFLADARRGRAEGDANKIAGALGQLMKDTGQYPGNMVGSGVTFLVSEGNSPSGTVAGVTFDSATDEALADHLATNNPGSTTPDTYNTSGRFRWRGSYILEHKPDPYSNAYVVGPMANLKGNNTGPVWVLSAGEDGVLDTTSSTATAPSDDDIGFRIK